MPPTPTIKDVCGIPPPAPGRKLSEDAKESSFEKAFFLAMIKRRLLTELKKAQQSINPDENHCSAMTPEGRKELEKFRQALSVAQGLMWGMDTNRQWVVPTIWGLRRNGLLKTGMTHDKIAGLTPEEYKRVFERVSAGDIGEAREKALQEIDKSISNFQFYPS
ncbi:MAG: hypothetical protein C5B49_12800 [Bdellovibrio sp.]|nr:MAG: hypothetical protein C5B49_12800 [Bdellovibrio sp.]